MNLSRSSLARGVGAVALFIAPHGCVLHTVPEPVRRVPPSTAAPLGVPDGETWAARAIALPGPPGPVRMDYLAYDPDTRALWIPAGNTGRVDVLDTTTDAFRTIDGFATVTREVRGTRRVLGPSAVELVAGVAFVGNRGDASICAVDARTLARGACVTLPTAADSLTAVPALHELWATTPRDHTVTVLHLDGLATPSVDTTIALDGSPEGAALDPIGGTYYTNLEDADRTLAIDVHTRRVRATWSPRCGAEGPRGLALDAAAHQLFVACTDAVVALDLAHDGAELGRVATGGGVDGIAFWSARHVLYVGAGATGRVRVVRVDARGGLRVVASAATAAGVRNAVIDADGRAYLTDSAGGRIHVITPAP